MTDLDSIRERYGIRKRKITEIDREIAKRYKTKNLFRPDAEPRGPLFNELIAKATEISRRRQQREEDDERKLLEEAMREKQQQARKAIELPTRDFDDEEIRIARKDLSAIVEERTPDFETDVEDMPVIKRPEIIKKPEIKRPEIIKRPETLEKKLEDEIKTDIILTDAYEQGDNPSKELIIYANSNKVAGKPVEFILGENKTFYFLNVLAANGYSVLLGGMSRSGKSLQIDKTTPLLTSVFQVDICSNKALFTNHETVNQNDFLYFSEYQASVSAKGNEGLKETVKKITENKEARNTTNNNEYVKGDITILTTGADENKKVQNLDIEVAGRFIRLKTEYSKEKHNMISEYQDALDNRKKPSINFSKQRFAKLKQHVHNVINMKDVEFEDPFVEEYAKKMPVTQKSVYYRTLYKAMMKSCAKFEYPNRLEKDGDIIMNMSDIYLVFQYQYEEYCNTLRELSERSFSTLIKQAEGSPSEQSRLEDELQKELQEIEEKRNMPLDYKAIWDAGYKHMEEKHPELLNKWLKLQTRDGKVCFYDPIIDKDVHLCDVYPKPEIGDVNGTP